MDYAAAALTASATLNWGDVPTWAGVMAAVVAGIVGFFLYRLESKRDQETERDRRRAEQDRLAQAEDARRAQANRVTAWYGLFDAQLYARPRPGLEGRIQQGTPGAYIRNASDEPVYAIKLSFHYLHVPMLPVEEYTNEPSEPVSRGGPRSPIHVLPPGVMHFVEMPQGIPRLTYETTGDDTYLLGIEFRDAAGNLWERDAKGQLEEL